MHVSIPFLFGNFIFARGCKASVIRVMEVRSEPNRETFMLVLERLSAQALEHLCVPALECIICFGDFTQAIHILWQFNIINCQSIS